MNFGKFDQKTVEKSIINTIFKQQVISEPQKLLHFSRAWALVAYKLVALKKSVPWNYSSVFCRRLKRTKQNIKIHSTKLLSNWLNIKPGYITNRLNEWWLHHCWNACTKAFSLMSLNIRRWSLTTVNTSVSVGSVWKRFCCPKGL